MLVLLPSGMCVLKKEIPWKRLWMLRTYLSFLLNTCYVFGDDAIFIKSLFLDSCFKASFPDHIKMACVESWTHTMVLTYSHKSFLDLLCWLNSFTGLFYLTSDFLQSMFRLLVSHRSTKTFMLVASCFLQNVFWYLYYPPS